MKQRFKEVFNDRVVFGDGQFYPSESFKISLVDTLYLR